MKTILTTSALASAVLFSGLLFATPSIAQDNEPCVGENCPAPDMQGGKKRKGMEQNNQGGDDSADQDQDMPRKKRTQNSQNTDVDVDVDVRTGSSQRTRNANWQLRFRQASAPAQQERNFPILLRRLLVSAALLGNLLGGRPRQLRRRPRHCRRALQSRARRRVQGSNLYLSRPSAGRHISHHPQCTHRPDHRSLDDLRGFSIPAKPPSRKDWRLYTLRG